MHAFTIMTLMWSYLTHPHFKAQKYLILAMGHKFIFTNKKSYFVQNESVSTLGDKRLYYETTGGDEEHILGTGRCFGYKHGF